MSAMAKPQESLLSQSNKAIVEHCLGLSKIDNLGPLADNFNVVCLDPESWIRDNNKLTEMGIAKLDMRNIRASQRTRTW
jgi:hypothetical protein